MKNERHNPNEGTNTDAGRDTIPTDSILRDNTVAPVVAVSGHRAGCPTAQAVSQDRLLELLLEKGRHIVSTYVPPGYTITDDKRDPDITQVAERTQWDNRMNR